MSEGTPEMDSSEVVPETASAPEKRPRYLLKRARAKNEAAICLRNSGHMLEAQRLAYDALRLTLLLLDQLTSSVEPPPSSSVEPSPMLSARLAFRLRRVQDEMGVYEKTDASGLFAVVDEPLRRCLEVVEAVHIRLDQALRTPAHRRRLRIRARMLVIAVAAMGIALLVWQSRPGPAWPYQVEYFPNLELEGVGDLVFESDIVHEWGEGPPLDTIPFGPFSARWITCFDVVDTQFLNIKMSCHGGCRVLVDSEIVLDQWRDGGGVAHAELTLEPGAHRLEVEYSDRQVNAELSVLVRSTRSATLSEFRPPTLDGVCAQR